MLEQILQELNQYNAKLIAVSKTKSPEEILEVYQKGHKIFGENRVEELVKKAPLLPSDIEWHMIGHLQSKKVKKIAPFIHCIQSVDSLKLLTEINKQAARNERTIQCLLQVKIATEESKFGLGLEELPAILTQYGEGVFNNIELCGLMGMGTFTNDMDQIRSELRYLSNAFQEIKKTYFKGKDSFKHLSMGMSGDYQVALEEGSNMVRIGTLIFGPRPCHINSGIRK